MCCRVHRAKKGTRYGKAIWVSKCTAWGSGPIFQYLAIAKFQAMSGKFTRTSTEMRRPSLSRSQLQPFPRL